MHGVWQVQDAHSEQMYKLTPTGCKWLNKCVAVDFRTKHSLYIREQSQSPSVFVLNVHLTPAKPHISCGIARMG